MPNGTYGGVRGGFNSPYSILTVLRYRGATWVDQISDLCDSGDREEFMIGNLTHRKNGFYSSKKVE